MQSCSRCHVRLRGAYVRCPLCHGPVEGEGEENFYPFIPVEGQPWHKVLRTAAYLSIVVTAFCVAMNIWLYHQFWWSAFVVAGVGTTWLSIWMAVKKRGNLLKGILGQTLLISLLAVVWDIFTGWHRWSLEFVLPVLCTATLVLLLMVARLCRTDLREYAVYLTLNLLLGGVVLFFGLVGWIQVLVPAVVCVAACVLSLAVLVLFRWELLRTSLSRWLHW